MDSGARTGYVTWMEWSGDFDEHILSSLIAEWRILILILIFFFDFSIEDVRKSKTHTPGLSSTKDWFYI